MYRYGSHYDQPQKQTQQQQEGTTSHLYTPSQQECKRPRLAVEPQTDYSQPLRIDTRDNIEVKKVGCLQC